MLDFYPSSSKRAFSVYLWGGKALNLEIALNLCGFKPDSAKIIYVPIVSDGKTLMKLFIFS
jgi:hypothetical protein